MNLKENEVMRCPKCGAMSFCVTAHVTQDWVVDEKGNFIKSNNDCVEVTHFPDENDIWDCNNCGYSAEGRKFVTTKLEDAPSETCHEDFPNDIEEEKLLFGEIVFDITTCVPQFTGKGAPAENYEYDSRDLYCCICKWVKEFQELYDDLGGDYLRAVEAFAVNKLRKYFGLED